MRPPLLHEARMLLVRPVPASTRACVVPSVPLTRHNVPSARVCPGERQWIPYRILSAETLWGGFARALGVSAPPLFCALCAFVPAFDVRFAGDRTVIRSAVHIVLCPTPLLARHAWLPMHPLAYTCSCGATHVCTCVCTMVCSHAADTHGGTLSSAPMLDTLPGTRCGPALAWYIR